MALYRYTAQKDSEIKTGVIEGEDQVIAAQNLQKTGLKPLSLKPYQKHRAFSFNFPSLAGKSSDKLNSGDIEFFTKQLALLVKGGMAIDAALRLMSRGSIKPALKSFTARLERKLKEGKSLSVALGEEPDFSVMHANIVKAGEEGGVLPEMLMNIAEYQAESRELKQFVISSSIYPAILLSMGVGILIILMTVILPRFEVLFSGMNKELPANVEFLMAVATFTNNHFIISIFLLFLPPIAFVCYFKSSAGREVVDRWSIQLPLLKTFIRDLETTRIFRTLEVLVKNGVHLVTALKICSKVAVNSSYQRLLSHATMALKEGQQVAPKLKGELIPDLAVDLLAIGENSGRIGEICGQIAEHFEQELRERLKRLVALIEPVFILVMALGAGYIVLSMLSVILSMNEISG